MALRLGTEMFNVAFVERKMRQALSDWYGFLATESRSMDDWLSLPNWVKQVPSRLDIPWALKDLQKMVGNKSMMRALYIVVDEIYLSSEGVEGLPDISLLRNELLKWYSEHVE